MPCISHHDVPDLSAARDSLPATVHYCFTNIVFTLNCKVCMLNTEQAILHQMVLGEDIVLLEPHATMTRSNVPIPSLTHLLVYMHHYCMHPDNCRASTNYLLVSSCIPWWGWEGTVDLRRKWKRKGLKDSEQGKNAVNRNSSCQPRRWLFLQGDT